MSDKPTLRIVAGIAVNQSGEIFISKRKKDAHLGDLWEFPGGKVEAGETNPEALRREFLEEVGLHVLVSDLFHHKTFAYPDRVVDLYFYWCSPASGAARALDVADFKWIAPAELKSHPFPPANEELLDLLAAHFYGQ